MSLYDALFLYGLALRDAYEEVGGYDVHQNGSLLWSKMTNRQFIGKNIIVKVWLPFGYLIDILFYRIDSEIIEVSKNIYKV